MLSTINFSQWIFGASWIDIKRHNWLCGRFTPLSDPLANGPNINHSTQVSLKIGTTLEKCLPGLKPCANEGSPSLWSRWVMSTLTGITCARQELPQDLQEFTARVRAFTDKPIAVGFGISTPEQARAVAKIADGVIIGSALIKTVTDPQDHPKAAGQFFHHIVSALESGDHNLGSWL